MTDFIYPEEQVISGFTLALLEDLGYLKIAKKYTGGLMRFGKNKGCEFINQKCKGPQKFENEFYIPENYEDDFTEPSCSSGRLSKTVHKLYINDDIPSEYQYILLLILMLVAFLQQIIVQSHIILLLKLYIKINVQVKEALLKLHQ